MLNIQEFHFNQTADVPSGLALKSVVVEFSFLTWRDRLSFVWKVLRNKTVREKSLFCGGPVVVALKNTPGIVE